jgi:hypothetical protein
VGKAAGDAGAFAVYMHGGVRRSVGIE